MKGFIAFGSVFLVLAAVSCSKPTERPSGILSKEEMVSVLSEIYIAEEKVSRMGLPQDSAQIVFRAMEDIIFKNLNIPDSVFRASQDYYNDHPIEMEAVYGTLVDSLQLREQRLAF